MHYALKSCWVTSMILRHNLVDSISVAVKGTKNIDTLILFSQISSIKVQYSVKMFSEFKLKSYFYLSSG